MVLKEQQERDHGIIIVSIIILLVFKYFLGRWWPQYTDFLLKHWHYR